LGTIAQTASAAAAVDGCPCLLQAVSELQDAVLELQRVQLESDISSKADTTGNRPCE